MTTSRMTWYSFNNDILSLKIHVHPGSNRDEIEGLISDRIKIRIKAPAVDNKANDYLKKFLAKQFGVSKSSVEISRGQKSRMKTLVIPSPKNFPGWFNNLC